MKNTIHLGISQRYALALLALLLSATTALAQSLHGTVTDARTGEPIIGAAISLRTTGQGKALAVTDVDGRFTVNVKQFPTTLIVNYTGYQTEEVDVYEVTDDNLDIALTENYQGLNEVVVVGYGTQKRQDMVSSISTVSKSLLSQPVSSVESVLAGSVAGINVTVTSGQPGASSITRIRGGNSITGGNEPLYVIDGFIVYNDPNLTRTGVANSDASVDPLAFLNPADIESIEVLKDVSATAIYGTRGANGVIVVTTKRGKGRTKANNITYAANFGWSSVAKKLDYLNASQWADLYNEIRANEGIDEHLATPTESYDWQDAALRTGFSQEHQVSISGSDELSRYSISGSYRSQNGIVKGTDQTRYTGRISYERDVFKHITVGVTANGAYNKVNGLANINSMFEPNSWVAAISHTPYTSIYNADGTFNYDPTPSSVDNYNGKVGNPISDLENTENETVYQRVIANGYAEWEVIPHLKLKATVGADLSNTRQNYYAPSYTTGGLPYSGYASIGQTKSNTWQTEYTANYNNVFNRVHTVDLLAGYTAQRTDRNGFASTGYGFSNDATGFNNLAAAQTLLPASSFAYVSTLQSWIGRVNYSYDARYSLSATIRADGSSRFAKDHRWGWFPSLGASWNIDREHFIHLGRKVDYLKLRASVGVVGNQEIGDYQFAANVVPTTVIVDGKESTGYIIDNLSNPDLKWETTKSFNVGFDASFYRGRLTFTFDAYSKHTSDLLVNAPVEEVTGFGSVLRNIGSVTNKGVEFEIGATPIERKDLQWDIHANIAHNRNKITSLGNSSYFIPSFSAIGTLQYINPLIVKVGEPLGTFYGYKFKGIVQQGQDVSALPSQTISTLEPGNPIFEDVNGDKVVNENDRVVLGNIQPDFTFGFNTKLQWKRFDLFFALSGSVGNKLFNALACRLDRGNFYYNSLAEVADRWTTTNPSNTIQKATSITSIFADDRFVEDASYLKVKNIQLGYTLPLPVITKGSQLYLYVSLQNFFTITGYSGYDPEANRNGIDETSALYQGVDYGAYPAAKTLKLGFNITF